MSFFAKGLSCLCATVLLLISPSGHCDSKPVSGGAEITDGRAQKGTIFKGNYWNLGVDNIEYAVFDKTPYAFHLVGDHDNTMPGVPPASATMLWLTRDLGSVPCDNPVMPHVCPRESIVDMAPVPPNEVRTSIIVTPQAYVPCTWRDKPILAILSSPAENGRQAVTAGWDFDLSHEKIVRVPDAEVNCKNYAADKSLEDARKEHLQYFLNSKISELSKLGLRGLRKLGKIIKDDVSYGTDDNNPAVKLEMHQIQYDGMTVAATAQHGGGFNGFYVSEVTITSPKWSVQRGLIVGSTKKQVQQTLGRGVYTECVGCSAASARVLSYSDEEQIFSLRFTFDSEDKVTSIEWQAAYP